MGKDGKGRERTGLTKNGTERPWCNGPLTLGICIKLPQQSQKLVHKLYLQLAI